MKPMLWLAIALAPTPVAAQSVFNEMIGTWRGEGQYQEGITEVALRCRFSISGDADAIDMAGRCASSLGAEDFTMAFERGPDQTALVRSGESDRAAGSSLDGLTGPLGRNGLVVKGQSDSEEVTVQLLLNEDGTLVFATRERSEGKSSVSYVTLTRQE